MERIIAPIKPGKTGAVVANLHTALFALLDKNFILDPATSTPLSGGNLSQLKKQLSKEQSQQFFGDTTTQLVLYFQLQSGLGDSLSGVVEERTVKILNAYLQDFGLFEALDSYTVRGSLKDNDGRPQPNIKVRAFDRDLRTAQPLGNEVITDEQGYYFIEYSAAEFANAETLNSTADLVVIAYNFEGTPIAESSIKFNADRNETIDLVFTTVNAQTLSEWQNITNIVNPLLQRQKQPITATNNIYNRSATL